MTRHEENSLIDSLETPRRTGERPHHNLSYETAKRIPQLAEKDLKLLVVKYSNLLGNSSSLTG